MDQSQRMIDDAEWHHPDNWAGLGPFAAYFSKRDSRVWVPHYWNNSLSPPAINFGHRLGFATWNLIVTIPWGILLLSYFVIRR